MAAFYPRLSAPSMMGSSSPPLQSPFPNSLLRIFDKLRKRLQPADLALPKLSGDAGRIEACVVQQDGLYERVFRRIGFRLSDRFAPLPAEKALLHGGGILRN